MEFLQWIGTEILLPAITLIVGFLAGKRKQRNEADAIAIENVEKTILIYKNMLDDIVLRYDIQIAQLNIKLQVANEHIAALETKIKELQKVQ